MEREAVLHWLEDVKSAKEELDGGLFNPDNLHHSSSSDATATFVQNSTEQTKPNPQLPYSYTGHSLVPSSSFQVPQDPSNLIVRKRSAFKHSRSSTLSNEVSRVQGGLKLTGQSPSLDFPERGNIGRNSLSPIPTVNPDMNLPTISLMEGEHVVPRRKPLLKKSTFFADLKTNTPLPSQLLQSSSTAVLKRGKSAPASPDTSEGRKNANCESLSVISITAKSYSQGDLRHPAQVTHRDSDASGESFASGGERSGSCIAERGELSDMESSDDGEMPCELDPIEDKSKTSMSANVVTESIYNKIKERVDVRETKTLQSGRSLTQENSNFDQLLKGTSGTHPFSSSEQQHVKTSPLPSLPIPPCNVSQCDNVKLSLFLAKRNPTCASSIQHRQCPSDYTNSRDTSLGLESLAFHDHHLDSKGSHKVTKTSMLDSSRFQEMSALQLLAHVTDSTSQLAKGKGSMK